jgi:hypothetical protein
LIIEGSESGSIPPTNGYGSGTNRAQKHRNPTDPDP